MVSWATRGDEPAALWVVYVQRGDTWSHEIVPGWQRSIVLADQPGEDDIRRIAMTAVDRCRNESVRAFVTF